MIGQRNGYRVVCVDQMNTNKHFDVSDSDLKDLELIPSKLSSDKLISRTQVNVGPTEVVTITAYYSTGIILV